jgi:hypothetical protein
LERFKDGVLVASFCYHFSADELKLLGAKVEFNDQKAIEPAWVYSHEVPIWEKRRFAVRLIRAATKSGTLDQLVNPPTWEKPGSIESHKQNNSAIWGKLFPKKA